MLRRCGRGIGPALVTRRDSIPVAEIIRADQQLPSYLEGDQLAGEFAGCCLNSLGPVGSWGLFRNSDLWLGRSLHYEAWGISGSPPRVRSDQRDAGDR